MRKRFLLPVLVVALVWSGPAAAGPSPPPPIGAPSPFPTALPTPNDPFREPETQSAAAILEDLDTGQVLYARHPDDRRAVASVTKIMTALVVLQRSRPTDVVTVSAEAAEEGSRGAAGLSELGLQRGERLTVLQLLYALMLPSANDAAVALADHVSGTSARFVASMNREAHRLGLTRTKFYSPNGVDDRGYSTPRSLASLTRRAERIPQFSRIARTKFRVLPAPPGGEPRRIQNRNVLLWLFPGAVGVKTGFTTRAGYCLVAAAQLHGTRLVAVVLGEPSGEDSFSDAAALMNYGFDAFVDRQVIEAGQPLPPLTVNDVVVPIVAGAALTAWVAADDVDDPLLSTTIRPLHPPLSNGETVGYVKATLHGLVLGRVPVVVAGPPDIATETRPAPSVSWLRQGLDSVNRLAEGLFHAVFG